MKWVRFIFGKAFSWFVYLCPFRAQLGQFVGWLWFDLFKIRQKVILGNIRKVFPEISEKEAYRIGSRSMGFIGRGLIDYALMPHLNPKNIDAYGVLEGTEILDRALERGKGVFLLTLHSGQVDLASATISLNGYPMSIIAKSMSIGWLDELLLKLRQHVGIHVLPPKKSTPLILESLSENRLIGFPLDQYAGPPFGAETTFFGHPTGTSTGLARLLQKCEASVVLTYSFRDEDGRHRVVFKKDVTELKNSEPDSVRLTQAFTDELESIVLAYPEHWMWLHKRWKPFVVPNESLQSEKEKVSVEAPSEGAVGLNLERSQEQVTSSKNPS